MLPRTIRSTAGTLCLLDRGVGTEGAEPITRLTPEVPFPETEANVDHFFANPWPLSEEYFLVAWSDQKLPPHCRATEEQNPRNATGIYLLDAFRQPGTALSRSGHFFRLADAPGAARAAACAGNLRREARSPGKAVCCWRMFIGGSTRWPRGTVKQLRLVAVPPKVQPHMNQPSLGVSAEDPGKFVLGTVPVERRWFGAFSAAFRCARVLPGTG